VTGSNGKVVREVAGPGSAGVIHRVNWDLRFPVPPGIGRGGGGRDLKDDACFANLPDMLALARLPNVAVKLSGAPSYSTAPYPYRNIHGYLRQIVDAFGPDRCFWGTDITRMPCSYRQCVTMFTEEMPWLKGRDLDCVMGGAIINWLGWKRPAGK